MASKGAPKSVILTNFTSGELTPRLGGRVDYARYANGLESLENMVIQPHGGVSRRPGMNYVGDIIGRDRVQVGDFASDTVWTKGTDWTIGTGVATKTAGTASNLTQDIDAVTGHRYVVTWTVTRTAGAVRVNGGEWRDESGTYTERFTASAETLTIEADATFAGAVDNISCMDETPSVQLIPFEFNVEQSYILEFTAERMRVYMNGGIVMDGADPFELTIPWGDAEMGNIDFCQSADTLFLTSPSRKPYKIERTGHAAWTVTALTLNNGPFERPNYTDTTLAPSATSGSSITITASAATFASTDVGRLVSILHTNTWGIAEITAYTDTTHVTAKVTKNFGATSAVKDWKLGAFSDTIGWPRCIALYEERLAFAGSDNSPQTIWLSQSNDFTDFSVSSPLTVSDACTFTLAADQVHVIQWLHSCKQLQIGTAGGEWWLAGSSGGEDALSPTTVLARRETNHGCAKIKPLSVGYVTLFVQRQGKKIHEFFYAFEKDAYSAPNLTILAEHITRDNPIVSWCYQQEPDGVIWVVLDDGTFMTLTYEREQQVAGFARHSTTGNVKSVASLRGETNHDEVWFVVERERDDVTYVCLEMLAPHFEGGDIEDAIYLDSALTYDGAAATTISGLDHLEGQTVQVLAEGSTMPDQVVSGGAVTLPRAVTKCHVGLGYTSTMKTMRLDMGAMMNQSGQGRIKKISHVTARVYDSVGFQCGPSADHLYDVPMRRSDDGIGRAIEPRTEDIRVTFPAGYDRDAQIMIQQYRPLPLTVLALIPEVEVY